MSDELKELLQSYLATSVVTQDLIDRIDAEFRGQQSVIAKLTKDYNSLEDDVHYNRDCASEHQGIFDAIRDEAGEPIQSEGEVVVPIPYAVWKRATEKARGRMSDKMNEDHGIHTLTEEMVRRVMSQLNGRSLHEHKRHEEELLDIRRAIIRLQNRCPHSKTHIESADYTPCREVCDVCGMEIM